MSCSTLRVGGRECLAQLDEDGGQFFAMAAPRCVEFDEEEGVVGQHLREIRLRQLQDAVFGGVGPAQGHQGEDRQVFEHLIILISL